MSVFIDTLREAHAVTTAHMMGDDSCAAICRRTRLPVPTVREWLRLLNLPSREPLAGTKDFQPGFVLDAITKE